MAYQLVGIIFEMNKSSEKKIEMARAITTALLDKHNIGIGGPIGKGKEFHLTLESVKKDFRIARGKFDD